MSAKLPAGDGRGPAVWLGGGTLFFRPARVTDPIYVPHQQEDRLIEFDLLTSTVDDIISRCGYPEYERSELAEVHGRLAEHGLQFYRGPRPERIPLLEGTP